MLRIRIELKDSSNNYSVSADRKPLFDISDKERTPGCFGEIQDLIDKDHKSIRSIAKNMKGSEFHIR